MSPAPCAARYIARKLSQFQRGQSLVETLIIFPSLLLIIFGIIQFAFIYQAKGLLNYATFVGARQGALSGGKESSIQDGVASGLTPMFMRNGFNTEDPGIDNLVKARLISALEVFNPTTARVEIVNPTPEAITAYNLGAGIPNDHLSYRTQTAGARAAAGMTIQDANLLKIRVTYCVKLIVPFIGQLIYGIVTGLEEIKGLARSTFNAASEETKPNFCSTANINPYNVDSSVINKISAFDFASMNPVPELSPVADALAAKVNPLAASTGAQLQTAVNEAFARFVKSGLGWDMKGPRIPIVAESIVRMQSAYGADASPPSTTPPSPSASPSPSATTPSITPGACDPATTNCGGTSDHLDLSTMLTCDPVTKVCTGGERLVSTGSVYTEGSKEAWQQLNPAPPAVSPPRN